MNVYPSKQFENSFVIKMTANIYATVVFHLWFEQDVFFLPRATEITTTNLLRCSAVYETVENTTS